MSGWHFVGALFLSIWQAALWLCLPKAWNSSIAAEPLWQGSLVCIIVLSLLAVQPCPMGHYNACCLKHLQQSGGSSVYMLRASICSSDTCSDDAASQFETAAGEWRVGHCDLLSVKVL